MNISTQDVAAQPIAFRCTKCFQLRCTDTDAVGQSFSCDLCGHENIVPEPTAERIAQGLEYLQQAATEEEAAISFATPSDDMSDAEIMQQAKQEMFSAAEPSALVCSKMKRFLGAVVDSLAAVSVIAVAAILAVVIAPATGAADEPNLLAAAILIGLPTMFALIQMILVATEGRTIGKYAVNSKIVNAQGDPPGFLQGVVLRYFVNALLGIIPFYGLVDVCVIFANDSHRCIHDYLAGTYVIDAG